MKKLACLAALVFLSGCAQYASSIKIGNTTFKLPKDATFDWLQASVPVAISNGVVVSATITITNGSFKMNPVVIDKVTQHDVAVISATGQLVIQAVAAAAGAAK